MPLLLVRHADAGDRDGWDGDDAARPLTAAGRADADAIVDVLAGYAPARVLSSPAARCVQTVEPLAHRMGRTVEHAAALFEGAGADAVRLVEDLHGSTAVLCSHGDVVPEVLTALERRGLELSRPVRWEKASTWVLHGDGARWTRAEYLPPPSARSRAARS